MKKLILLLILTVIANSAFCKTITVTSSGNSGLGTLRQAIIDANYNDSIVFADSVRVVTQSSFIRLDKSITICGSQSNPVTILASNIRHFLIPDMTGIGDPITASFNNLIFKNAYYSTCGGSIYNRKGNTLTLNNCSFINNKAGETAGAIDNVGTLTLNNCVFDSNTCISTGVGAVQNAGKMYINNTRFTNNKANKVNTPSAYGPSAGAVYNHNNCTLLIINSLFEGNQGDPSGGLINRGIAYVVNCLFIDNTSSSFNNTGAIFNFKFGTYDVAETSLTIVNSTITNNIGKGIYNNQKLNLHNSITYNNETNNDIYNDSSGTIVSSNNLIGTSNVNLSGNENIFNTDPLFIGNGDYSLAGNSPAINSGVNSFLPDTILTDLLGNPRIYGALIDLGAYEYQTTASNLHILKSDINIYSIGHTIYVDNTSLFLVSIYDMMGELVAQGNKSVFQVSHAGVYLVCINNTVQKVIVK